MGALSELFELIVKLFTLLFTALWYLVSACVGLVSCVAVWRIGDILSSDDWAFQCWINFFLLLVDCITIPLGLAALAVPWRAPFALMSYSGLDGMDLRSMFVSQFFISITDCISVPLGLIALFIPWRSMSAFTDYKNAMDQSDDSRQWNSSLRQSFLANFVIAMLDTLVLPFALICMFSISRTRHAFFLLTSGDPNCTFDLQIRIEYFKLFFYFLLDLMTLPMSLFVAVTGLRLPKLIHALQTIDGFELQMQILIEFMLVFVDIPHAALLLLMTLTGWRYEYLTESGCFGVQDQNMRHMIRHQFKLWLVNVVSFAMFTVIECSGFRTVQLFRRVRSDWESPPSAVAAGESSFLDYQLPFTLADEFVELILAIAHLVVFLVTMTIHPVRGLISILLILEPLPKWSMRLRSKAVDLLSVTDAKCTEYSEAVRELSRVALKELEDQEMIYFYIDQQMSLNGDVGRITLKDWVFFSNIVPSLIGYQPPAASAPAVDDSVPPAAEKAIAFEMTEITTKIEAPIEAVKVEDNVQVALPESSNETAVVQQNSDQANIESHVPPTIAESVAEVPAPLPDVIVPVSEPVVVSTASSDELWSVPTTFSEQVMFVHRSQQTLAWLELNQIKVNVSIRDGGSLSGGAVLTQRLSELAAGLRLRVSQTTDALHLQQQKLDAEISAYPGCLSPWNVFDRDSSEFRTILQSSVMGALADWVALVGFVTNIVLMYRASDMFRAVARTRTWDGKRLAIINVVIEYWLDAFAAGGLLLLTVTIWPAVSVWSDLIEYVASGNQMIKPSIFGARALIKRHLDQLAQDINDALSYVFSMHFFILVCVTLFTGIFTPLVVMLYSLRLLKMKPKQRSTEEIDVDFSLDDAGELSATAKGIIAAEDRDERPTDSVFDGGCCGLCSPLCQSLYYFIALLTLPLVLIFKVVPDNTSYIIVPLNSSIVSNTTAAQTVVDIQTSQIDSTLISFLILLFCCALFGILAATRSKSMKKIVNPSRFVRLNYQNAMALLSVLLDAFQMCSIPLTLISTVSTNSNQSNSSNAIMEWLTVWGKNLLLFQQNQFTIVFWLSFALVVVWFFVVSIPFATKLYGDDSFGDNMVRSTAYRMLVQLFGNVLYLPVAVNLLKALQCDHNSSNALIASPNLACWRNEHIPIALSSMLALFFFVITTQVFHSAVLDKGESNSTDVDGVDSLDIKYAPVYIAFLNAQKLALTVALTLFARSPTAVLVICLLGACAMIAYTMSFQLLSGAPTGPCCIAAVSDLRIGSFVALLFVSCVAFVEVSARNGSGSSTDNGLVLVIGLGAIGFVTVLVALYRLHSTRLNESELKLLDLLRQQTQQLFDKMHALQAFADTPLQSSIESFRASILAASHPGELADCLICIESNMCFYRLKASFYRSRQKWLTLARSEARSRMPALKVAVRTLTQSIRADIITELPADRIAELQRRVPVAIESRSLDQMRLTGMPRFSG